MRGARYLRRAEGLSSCWSPSGRDFLCCASRIFESRGGPRSARSNYFDDRTCRHLHGVSPRRKTRNITHALSAHIVLLSLLQCGKWNVLHTASHQWTPIPIAAVWLQFRYRKFFDTRRARTTPMDIDFSEKYLAHDDEPAGGNSWRNIGSGINTRRGSLGSNLTFVHLRNHVVQDRVSKVLLLAGVPSVMPSKCAFSADSPLEILKGCACASSTPIGGHMSKQKRAAVRVCSDSVLCWRKAAVK